MRADICFVLGLLVTPAIPLLEGQILQAIAAGAGSSASVGGSSGCTPVPGYVHCRVLTIDSAQVGGSTLTNFPVLVEITLGPSRIQSPNCYDVVFTSDSGGTTLIPWQQSTCSQSSGAIVDWALLASIPASANTLFYVSYDNAAVSAPQNSGANGPTHVWNSSFSGVWHLDETPVGMGARLSDSTSNGNDCTIETVSFLSSAGQIFNGVNPRTAGGLQSLSTPIVLSYGTAWGASWWVQAAASLNDSAIAGNTADYSYIRAADGSGNLMIKGVDGSYTGTPLGTFTPGTWYHFAVEVTAVGAVTFYKNGMPIGTGQIWGTINAAGLFGNNYGTYSYLELDELHFYAGNHGSGWIAAEYNGQRTPSTFLTVGAES